MSVLAFQAKEMVVVVLDGELRPVGVLGGVVSGGGATTLLTVTLTVLAVVELPAASLAIAVKLCGPLASVVVSQT